MRKAFALIVCLVAAGMMVAPARAGDVPTKARNFYTLSDIPAVSVMTNTEMERVQGKQVDPIFDDLGLLVASLARSTVGFGDGIRGRIPLPRSGRQTVRPHDFIITLAADPAGVAGGISEALVTTAGGIAGGISEALVTTAGGIAPGSAPGRGTVRPHDFVLGLLGDTLGPTLFNPDLFNPDVFNPD